MEDKKKKRKSRRRLIFLILGAAVLIALAAALIVNGGIGGTLEAIRGKPSENYYYEHPGKAAYAAVGRGFAVLNSTSLTVWDERGQENLSTILSFKTPELSREGDYAAAWDLGGEEVIFFTEKGLGHRLTTEGAIISVTVNAKGYMAVCTEETGYGGSVTVYNPNGRALYKAYSGSKYVYTARLNEGSELIVLTLGSGQSELTLYRLNDEEAKAKYTCDGLILDVAVVDGGYTAVTAEGLIFLNRSLEKRAEFGFDGKRLTNYALGKDIAAVVIGEYQLGGAHEIITLENDGSVIARLTTFDDIEWFDMGERALSILSTGKISVLTYRLEDGGSFVPPAGTERVLLRDDSTILAVGPYSTTLIETED